MKVTRDEPDFTRTSARGDPTILKREAETHLLIEDGHTAVIGGIYTRNTGRNVDQIPFFGDIPILGWAFKSSARTLRKINLLIFLTPYIVRTPTDLEERTIAKREEFTGESQEGLRWSDRERQAERDRERAERQEREAARAPDPAETPQPDVIDVAQETAAEEDSGLVETPESAPKKTTRSRSTTPRKKAAPKKPKADDGAAAEAGEGKGEEVSKKATKSTKASKETPPDDGDSASKAAAG